MIISQAERQIVLMRGKQEKQRGEEKRQPRIAFFSLGDDRG